jgi:hypothetical protein
MSRSLLPIRPGTRALARALTPQLAGQVLLVAAVLALPGLTRWGRSEPAPAADDAQIDRLMQEAIDAQRRQERAPESPRP